MYQSKTKIVLMNNTKKNQTIFIMGLSFKEKTDDIDLAANLEPKTVCNILKKENNAKNTKR